MLSQTSNKRVNQIYLYILTTSFGMTGVEHLTSSTLCYVLYFRCDFFLQMLSINEVHTIYQFIQGRYLEMLKTTHKRHGENGLLKITAPFRLA